MFSQIRRILIACIILVVLGGFFQTAAADTEANKALVQRMFDEIWNKGNLDVVDEIIATNYVNPSDNIRGPEEFKQFVAGLLTGFPDLHMTIEDQIAEGDKEVHRWTGTGNPPR